MAAYRPGEPSSSRVESESESEDGNGPFKKFGQEDLIARDKVDRDHHVEEGPRPRRRRQRAAARGDRP
ncbi:MULTISPECIES: hypothetical protein [unclassified Streptomyces]|uniref:hypothetical protein n=1 Tax=unclassified Streptomyces TaxID=2593676 RepID=UPI000784C971|nr:hypothetical protein [Streptomyces sp. AVP053U2]